MKKTLGLVGFAKRNTFAPLAQDLMMVSTLGYQDGTVMMDATKIGHVNIEKVKIITDDLSNNRSIP